MNYCNRCILPDTRPGITIDPDGMCNACKGHLKKSSTIDWPKRAAEFEALCNQARKLSRPYDCVVPVSGGKDSTYQVLKCLQYGLKVLAVTWRSPGRTRLGQKNLDNLISLGVDHIDFTINPQVERRLTFKSFRQTGSSAVAMHMALYIIPLRMAVAFNIPLVVWGEDPFMEYGEIEEHSGRNSLDRQFLEKHGILQGTKAEDWIGDDLTLSDLEIYRLPSDQQFSSVPVRSLFIGHFFNWSPQETFELARQHGFQPRDQGPKVGYYNFADIDCDFISIHHYFKWLKFGFTRLFDNLSLEIRNGFITRQEALEILGKTGAQTPHSDIAAFCSYLGITVGEFWEIAEKFRNRKVWNKEDGIWKIRDFIVTDWEWQQ